jgi:tight adherence protein B
VGIVILVGMLIGLAIMFVFVGVAQTQELASPDRLDEYVSDQLAHARQESSRRSTRLGQSANELAQGMEKILRSVSALDQLAYALQRADLRLTVIEYLAIWLFSLTAAATAGYLISHDWLSAAMAGLFGALLPHLFVRLRQTARLQAFNNQLGTTLMQLSGSMRAGYGLLQAIDFVAHEMPPRVGSSDLMLIVTAIRIHHETGGNLAEILETVAETIRERVRIKGELRSLTAQQRLSGYALAVLPIILFFILMLINPQYESHLFTPGPTLCIPIGALVSMLLGLVAIRLIISIEV